ncbi:hypothetical protein RCL_jg18306.t1 [Rhizophagus clarus]|uniref:Uncharacterized protein n=1 Tax=Rhizophagus clarus TaxID=94130 RepID=A0A8H3LHX4_9GLOM|nr:hypothetical protein RCL_jg18306.t1 [Rhizophagus clarus]
MEFCGLFRKKYPYLFALHATIYWIQSVFFSDFDNSLWKRGLDGYSELFRSTGYGTIALFALICLTLTNHY